MLLSTRASLLSNRFKIHVMKKPIMLIALVAGLFFACKHQVVNPDDSGSGGGNNNGGGTDTTGTGGGTGGSSLVCFEGDILPLFQSGCAISGCHDSKTKAEGYVFDTYANITKKGVKPGNPDASKILQVIKSGEMPPKGYTDFTADQISLISKWIEEGAQNTTNCAGCDSAVFTYSGAVAPIMTTNCTGCHSSTNASGGINLSTYAGVKTVALNGRLMGAINKAPGYIAMPPSGTLSDCNIQQLQKWIDAGTPNN